RSPSGRFLCDDDSMRADRLVAILMLLQTRGQVTAAEVAAELEVSERTARRDLDALGMAGLPIYSMQRRNGGWRPAGGPRPDLSRRVVHPLGLAAKGPAWYLVAGTDAVLRTFRVDRITSIDFMGQPVIRPDGFDLTEAWRLITDEVEQRRTPVHARARAVPTM